MFAGSLCCLLATPVFLVTCNKNDRTVTWIIKNNYNDNNNIPSNVDLSVFILCCSYYIRSINFYQVFFVVYFNGFLLVPAFIINFTLFINSVYLKDACRWNTKINSPKFFYSLAPSFLLNLGQGVSSHCKGLQSHLCD